MLTRGINGIVAHRFSGQFQMATSDPVGFTTNILTLASFTIGAAGCAAAWTSFCATSGRYASVIQVLSLWEDYLNKLTPQEREYFERIRPGEFKRMTEELAKYVDLILDIYEKYSVSFCYLIGFGVKQTPSTWS